MKSPPLSNEDFVKQLLNEADNTEPAVNAQTETFALSDWFQSIKETVSRLGSAPSDATTALILGLARKDVHLKASRFLGDVFVYLNNRGSIGSEGEIVKTVRDAIRTADQARSVGDEKLIVIGHSLGGLIAYDIFTYFEPGISIDVFASIGSQVALFEEMTLCKISRDKTPPNPPADHLPKPNKVAKWINVYDTNDVFSFRASLVFNDAADYQFDTGYGLLEAHGGYFARPSFYKRLAVRIG
jgi:hypothetical protein